MINNAGMENKELDLEEIIKAVRNMAEIKQMMFKHGIYNVERSEKNSDAHVKKTLLEKLAYKNNNTISFISRNCNTYPYEGRINIHNVIFYARYTIDDLILYVKNRKD